MCFLFAFGAFIGSNIALGILTALLFDRQLQLPNYRAVINTICVLFSFTAGAFVFLTC